MHPQKSSHVHFEGIQVMAKYSSTKSESVQFWNFSSPDYSFFLDVTPSSKYLLAVVWVLSVIMSVWGGHVLMGLAS